MRRRSRSRSRRRGPDDDFEYGGVVRRDDYVPRPSRYSDYGTPRPSRKGDFGATRTSRYVDYDSPGRNDDYDDYADGSHRHDDYDDGIGSRHDDYGGRAGRRDDYGGGVPRRDDYGGGVGRRDEYGGGPRRDDYGSGRAPRREDYGAGRSGRPYRRDDDYGGGRVPRHDDSGGGRAQRQDDRGGGRASRRDDDNSKGGQPRRRAPQDGSMDQQPGAAEGASPFLYGGLGAPSFGAGPNAYAQGVGGKGLGAGGCFNPAAFWEGMSSMAEAISQRKRRRSESVSSSSSSSSSASDWRAKVWRQGFQAWPSGWPGAWPGPGAAGKGQAWGGPQGFGEVPLNMGPSKGHGRASEKQPKRQRQGIEPLTELPREPPPEDIQVFLEPAVEDSVPVPRALLGKVIGKNAQTIIEIREKSGAFKVDAREQNTDPVQVKVKGTAESVKKARALIEELVESTKNRHAGSDFVEIPRTQIGKVIGIKGAQVNDIQKQTGTKIDVELDMDPCKCYIKGDPASVEKAKHVLLTIAMQIQDEGSEYLELPRAAAGALIGVQGARVRSFQEISGARIDVDKSGGKCRVRLAGEMSQVAYAKQLIMAEVEKASAPRPVLPPMTVPPPPSPMEIPSHQPTSFPATISESIARAKAAAMAVNSGLVTGPAGGCGEAAGDNAWPGDGAWSTEGPWIGDGPWSGEGSGGDGALGEDNSWGLNEALPPPPSSGCGGKGGGLVGMPESW